MWQTLAVARRTFGDVMAGRVFRVVLVGLVGFVLLAVVVAICWGIVGPATSPLWKKPGVGSDSPSINVPARIPPGSAVLVTENSLPPRCLLPTSSANKLSMSKSMKMPGLMLRRSFEPFRMVKRKST